MMDIGGRDTQNGMPSKGVTSEIALASCISNFHERVVDGTILSNNDNLNQQVLSANQGETVRAKPASLRKRGRPTGKTNKVPNCEGVHYTY